MRRMISRPGAAALAGALIVLPLLILQFVNTTITKQQSADLVVLFGLLWLLSSAFVVSLTYLVRSMRSGAAMASRSHVLFSATLVIVFGLALCGLIVDQMPCFLGVPNCD